MAEPVTRRNFLKAAILAPLLPSLLAACRRADDKKVVNFFNWSNYIGKDTLPEFTKRTGVDVRYDLFADEDVGTDFHREADFFKLRFDPCIHNDCLRRLHAYQPLQEIY